MITIDDKNYIKTENILWADLTTFQLGGQCRGVCECQNQAELIKVLAFFQIQQWPVMVIGQGSNLLVSDQGLDVFVIRYFSDQPILRQICEDVFEVEASTRLDGLAAWAAQEGLNGLTFASGIPGTVGGAVVGNAGAYGQQIGDLVKAVRVYDPKFNTVKRVNSSELNFSYRESSLKNSGEIILSVELMLSKGHRQELLTQRQGILDERKDKHPDWRFFPSAGSIFKNVAPTSDGGRRKSAGWFLDEAGAKVFAINGAKVFLKHANIIIKDGECCAQDVVDLIHQMQAAVKSRFGIDLEPEVRILGKFR